MNQARSSSALGVALGAAALACASAQAQGARGLGLPPPDEPVAVPLSMSGRAPAPAPAPRPAGVPLSMAGRQPMARPEPGPPTSRSLSYRPGSLVVDEQRVRAEVMRRLQRRIEERQRRLNEAAASAPQGRAAPAPRPTRAEPLRRQLQDLLDEGGPPAPEVREPSWAPPRDRHAAVAPSVAPSPGRVASPSAHAPPSARAPAAPPSTRTLAETHPGFETRSLARRAPPAPAIPRRADGLPQGFVDPEEVQSGRGWSLPEDLRGMEVGILPPEVTGEPTPPRSRLAPGAQSTAAPAAVSVEHEIPEPSQPPAPSRPETHTMAPGETLWALARRYGLSVQDLMRANGIRDVSGLSVGRTLRIPPQPGVPAAAADLPGARVQAPTRHRVEAGDTFFRIARRYGVTVDELIRANPSASATHLTPGMELTITTPGAPAAPAGGARSSLAAAPSPRAPTPRPRRTAPAAARRAPPPPPVPVRATGRGAPDLIWPILGTVTARFGWKEGRPHTGVDVNAPLGTPIKAAASGRVIFSGTMRGYGKVVILDHLDGFFTVYGHNQENLVSKSSGTAATVRQGQVIARVGATGDAVGPQLHFEVRKLNQAVDPLRYLPQASARAGR